MGFYQWAWVKKDAFLQRMPDLLKPAILAQGYDLYAEDVGKQVYVRGDRGITQTCKSYFWTHAPNDELRRATKLTVGYVLTPSETRVQFTWENPYYAKRTLYHPFLNSLSSREATGLYEYLEDWYKAANRCENEGDAPPPEGSQGELDRP